MSALDLSLLDGSPVSIEAARVDAVRALPRAVLPAALDAAALVRVGGRWIAVRLDTSGGKMPAEALADLEAAVAAAASPGAPIWEWNGVDAGQFLAPVAFKNRFGSGPEGSAPSLGVEQSGQARSLGSDVLVFDVPSLPVALAGGWLYRVRDLTLPERFDVELDVDFMSGSGCTFGVFLGHVGGGVVNGLFVNRTVGASGAFMGRVVGGTQQTSALSFGAAVPAQPDASLFERGADRCRLRVRRAMGQAPALWEVAWDAVGKTERAHAAVSSQMIGGAPPEWDGIDMDSVGLAIFSQSSPTHNTVRVARFAIYAAGERF